MGYEAGQRWWIPGGAELDQGMVEAPGDAVLEILGVKEDGTLACCDYVVYSESNQVLNRAHQHRGLPLPEGSVRMEFVEEDGYRG